MNNSKNKNKDTKLKSIDGKKFRIMWSTKIMYFFFFIDYCAFAMAVTACSFDSKESIYYGDVIEFISFNIIIIFIILLLIYINKKYLGRVVAVVNDKGIHSSAGFIAWKDIKSVRYHARIPAKHMTTNNFYCSLSIYTNKKEFEIYHAPSMLLLHIKKKKPDVKIKCDFGLIAFLVCPFIFGIVIGLLNR